MKELIVEAKRDNLLEVQSFIDEQLEEVGAIGTALVVAAGIKGEDVLELAQKLVKANHVYTPDPKNKEVYERNYRVFKNLYKSNAAYFKQLNS